MEKEKRNDKMIDLETFAGGIVSEKVNKEFARVMENIADPNTDFKTKRKLTIELEFKADESRDLSTCDIKVKSKTAPPKAIGTKILIGRDFNSGKVIGKEYGNQLKGQMNIEDVEIEVIEPREGGLKVLKTQGGSNQ